MTVAGIFHFESVKDENRLSIIFSENPENDLWRELLQFTYEANVKRYLDKKKLQTNEVTIDCIVGSFLQAYEYFKLAKKANIQIAPLLLYYGSINLLYGMTGLLKGTINKISNHGMNIIIPEKMSFIADTKIRFLSPLKGGVHVISRAIGFETNLTSFGDWHLNEFLDSIAEINYDYIQCYGVRVGRIAMLDVFNTPDGNVEKIYFSKENKDEILELLSDVEEFKKTYLRTSTAKDYNTGKEYYVLRRKLTGREISEVSYSGQPYLRAGHRKKRNLITIPSLLNMYIALYVLASICRYHPEIWSPFVLKDATGEKLLLEKFLYYSRRMIPNYALNIILGEKVQYTSDRYSEINTIKLVGEHQVQEIIESKVKEQLDNEQLDRNLFI